MFADAITTVLDALDLSPDQRLAAQTKILPAHLRLLAGGSNTEAV